MISLNHCGKIHLRQRFWKAIRKKFGKAMYAIEMKDG